MEVRDLSIYTKILIGDIFYEEFNDAIDCEDLDYDEIKEWDEWDFLQVQFTKESPIHDKKDIERLIEELYYQNEERYPEDPDSTIYKVEKIFMECFDMEKFLKKCPKLYYPNGEGTHISRNELLNYIEYYYKENLLTKMAQDNQELGLYDQNISPKQEK